MTIDHSTHFFFSPLFIKLSSHFEKMNEGPRWGSSRTRERNKARYLIRNHVAMECEDVKINAIQCVY